tara:strand:+ start:498 stop:701 length:204 start_codon:yes stop_codon:yes gene_type:complete
MSNGIGTVMDDKVMSDISVWDCIKIVETDGKVSGLKIKPTIEKLLLQIMKANDDIEFMKEIERKEAV